MQALELAPDVIVGGRYRLVAPLARGGTSSVWRAADIETSREVAIKVLRDDGVDPALRRRAEREASVLTDLAHPNLVQVLDSGDGDGRTFIVMALLEGDPLTTVISERGPLPVDEAVSLVADVADGLGAAHERGVIHRDVKPGNIVCHEQVPTLVDFGIARAVDATTLTRGLVVGTASYFAPEQAQGMPLSPAADVYALACVLYELLIGEPPFTGDTPVTVALKHVQEDPVPPGDRADVPAAVNAVIMKALAKDPMLRPADGNAFATALRDALATTPDDATISIAPVRDSTMVMAPVAPVAPPPARGRFIRPRYVIAAAVIGFLLPLLVLTVGRDSDRIRSVPDVTNASLDEATTYLEGAGLDVDTTNVPSGAPAGTVVGSDPPAGDAIPRGGTVHLSVSSGPPPVPTTTTTTTTEPRRDRGKHHKGD